MKNIFNSELISKYISQEIIDLYKADFDNWVKRFDMRKFIGKADHFAVKVENEIAFNLVAKEFESFCVKNQGETPGLSIRKMHDRKIAVAILKSPIQFENDLINCIEIMQPKPEFEGKDVVGLDHLEFLNSNLDQIEKSLKETDKSYYVDESNPYKEIVVSYVNDRKERIKFTNKTLAEIVPIQIIDEPERVEIILN